MTRIATETFQDGTVGDSVTVGNTIFQAAQPNAIFRSDSPMVGTKYVRCTVGSTSDNALMSYPLGALKSLLYLEVYIRLSAYPSAPLFFLAVNASGTLRAQLRINEDGTVTCRNNITAVWTSSTPIPLNTVVRIEWKVQQSTGQQVWAYSGFSTTELFNSGLQTYNAGTFNTANCGITAATTNATIDVDYFAIDDSTKIGPAGGTANTPPTASAAVTPSTGAQPFQRVSLVGTDNDPDGSIAARLWTCDDPDVVIAAPTAKTTTAKLDGSKAAKTYTFTYTVTDNSGATASGTATCAALGTPERIRTGSGWVPCEIRLL